MSLRPEGQDVALTALRAFAAAEATAPRTLLLAGPEGVGRRAVARWYAALRNCVARLDDPCGRCPACLAHAPDADGVVASSDYREIGPALTTRDGKVARRPQLRIEQLVPRERGDDDPLGPWLQRAPQRRHRVGVIDHAETLTEEAANAFLKTLEEPPRHATVVLVAPGPDALLPTVASRCTTVRLVPAMAPAAVRDALAPHPALRLGRPDAWRAALADPAATAAKRTAVANLLDALQGDLADAFAAAEALAALWDATDDEVAGLLREAWRSRGAAAYAEGDEATAALERAWSAYAQRDLALRAWVLRLRRSASGATTAASPAGAGLSRRP
jgi:DNA polymerase III subunit delta'